MASEVPFVIGQWVRGPRFYGRSAQLEALLSTSDRALWFAGLRRIGKTSLLREMESRLAAERPSTLPLFWDFQGVDSPSDLAFSLTEALLDAEDLLERHAISTAEIEASDLAVSVERLLAATDRAGLELVLLCDEVDVLLSLEEHGIESVRSAWQAVLDAPRGRVVMASSVRLEDLARETAALGRWVGPFGEPTYLPGMTEAESRSLVRQERLPSAARPPFDATVVDAICSQCGGHPMLLQILGKRALERSDPAEAIREVAADRTLSHLFEVDFELLAKAERDSLERLAAGGTETHSPVPPRLLELGLVDAPDEGGRSIPNRFLASWLTARNARD